MTNKQDVEIEELFQKAFQALNEKMEDENSEDDPRIYLDMLSDIFERQEEEKRRLEHK